MRGPPACHLLWLLPNCRPDKPTLEATGTEEPGARSPALSCRVGAACGALSPRCLDSPPCAPKPTKDWTGRPAQHRTFSQGRLRWMGRPSIPTFGDRKEPVSDVCGHTMGCTLDRAFPSASVNISQPPLWLGAASSRDREASLSQPGDLIYLRTSWTSREWPCLEGGFWLSGLAPLLASAAALGNACH